MIGPIYTVLFFILLFSLYVGAAHPAEWPPPESFPLTQEEEDGTILGIGHLRDGFAGPVIMVTPAVGSVAEASNTYRAPVGSIVKSTTQQVSNSELFKFITSSTGWIDWPPTSISSVTSASEITLVTTTVQYLFIDNATTLQVFNTTDVTQIFSEVEKWLGDVRILEHIGSNTNGTLVEGQTVLRTLNRIRGSGHMVHIAKSESRRLGALKALHPSEYFIRGTTELVLNQAPVMKDPFPPHETFLVDVYLTYNFDL